MSTAWPSVSLGKLVRLERRPVEVQGDQEYKEIGIFSHGRGIFHKIPRSGLEVGEKDLFLMKEGDLILQITFAWEGAVALCGKEENGLYGSVRYPTFRVDGDQCFAPYLAKYLSTRQGLEQIGRICPGSAGRNRVLSLKRLPEISVPLPPLDEQRRIVAAVENLTEKVDQARTYRAELDSETKVLWRRAALGRLLDLSKTSPRYPLGDLVQLRGGGTPSKHEPRFWQGEIPWITPKDMKRRELFDSIDHISSEATRESSAKLIQPGAVLVVVRGMILAHTFPVALLRAPATINQDMKALIPSPEQVDASYLCWALWALNSEILELVDRSTHDTRKLLTEKLMAYKIPVPSLINQQRVVAELDALQVKVDTVKALQAQTAIEMDAVLPAVLDRAFKGELV